MMIIFLRESVLDNVKIRFPCLSPLEVIPVSRATQEVRRSRGSAVNELVFQVQAPPLGFTTYTVTLLKNLPRPPPPKHHTPAVIQNKVGCAAGSFSWTASHNRPELCYF